MPGPKPRPIDAIPQKSRPIEPLTTGPIVWDEQSLQQTRERMPNRVLLDAVLMAQPLGGLARILRSPLLRDMRLEWMFRR